MSSGTQSLFARGSVGRPVPRWALAATALCLLLPLPSVLWRLLMLSGVDVGFADADVYTASAGTVGYVLGLDAVEVLVGLACLGLAMRWGERVPRHVPVLGGWVIPRWLPAAICSLGLLAMLAIWGMLFYSLGRVWLGLGEGWVPDHGMDGTERAFLLACYVPFFAWPLAIITALVGYWRRRRPALTAS
jgi:hypothetical protein